MLKAIFTLDYEIHGNGDGCPYAMMVEPTERLLCLFEEFGAKLTIMADVAEILRFKAHALETGKDEFHSAAIEQQLQTAIRRGHDVQLHIHSSYFNSKCEENSWSQDWAEYDFARLPFARMDWMVKTSKAYLEALLKPVDPDYACVAFRAANWSVSPSTNIIRVLAGNGIRIDTSVFKYGRRDGAVAFDYSHADSPIAPWRVREDDICLRDDNGPIWEVPIYSEKRWIGAFLTVGRLNRVIKGLGHRVRRRQDVQQSGESDNRAFRSARKSRMWAALRPQAWKADFNQCDGGQLIRALDRASKQHDSNAKAVPFVLIGHSKLFTRQNERSLRPFLAHVSKQTARFGFDTLREMSRSQCQ